MKLSPEPHFLALSLYQIFIPKPGLTMRYFYLLLPFIVLINTISAIAQGWSTPVNVSNMGTHCNSPKMVVDHNGTIHAVWSSWVTQEYRKIMYSKSETHGDTWSTPIAIADDPQQWFGAPDITCDLQNNLYVSYEGDEMNPSSLLIYFVRFDGTTWSEPIILSQNYPGSNRSHLVADHTGRVYCLWLGWYANGYKIFYRYFENGVWSGLLIPYKEPNYWYFLSAVVADSSNNLHCVGVYKKYYNETGHGNIQYFSYAATGQWSPMEVISDTVYDKYNFRDICLDKNQVPHFVWGQKTVPFPGTANATLHRYADASGYLPIDSVETNHFSQDHQLEIDGEDQIYICMKKWLDLPNNVHKSYLFNYRKINNLWIEEIIDSINGVFYEPNTQIISDCQPGIIYFKGNSLPDSTYRDIFFSKKNIYTGDSAIPVRNLSSNPNPFANETKIFYTINTVCHTLLDIIDVNGKLIKQLTDQYQLPGQYTVIWHGNGLNGKEVKSGLYFVRLQAGSNVYTCKIAKQ